jgi:UDP-glucose 4-epimerase
MGKKVLVTGASGFLGSHTANALSRAGYEVVLFDLASSPYKLPEQTEIIGDIQDTQALQKAAKDCTYLYHFAGIADIEETKSKPYETCQSNILGTINALEAAKDAGAERFVFASTVYVYSNSGGFYRVSKQACENFIEQYQEQYNLPYTILRYGSLYGRRAGETNGIFKLIKSALENDVITYNGDPESMREYIHVADAAKLSVDILNEKYENKHVVLTGNERMRVADLMRMIAEMLPGNPALKFGEKSLESHYVMTPYNYSPKLGIKLVGTEHIDLGQGLLDCIAEFHEQEETRKKAS